MVGFRMVFISLLRVVIKEKIRWHVRTSQEKSYFFILLVTQIVKKAKEVTQAAQLVERYL